MVAYQIGKGGALLSWCTCPWLSSVPWSSPSWLSARFASNTSCLATPCLVRTGHFMPSTLCYPSCRTWLLTHGVYHVWLCLVWRIFFTSNTLCHPSCRSDFLHMGSLMLGMLCLARTRNFHIVAPHVILRVVLDFWHMTYCTSRLVMLCLAQLSCRVPHAYVRVWFVRCITSIDFVGSVMPWLELVCSTKGTRQLTVVTSNCLHHFVILDSCATPWRSSSAPSVRINVFPIGHNII